MVPNAYGPRTFGPPQWISNLFGPSGKTVPNQFGPHGQMFPNQFGPPGQMIPRMFRLSRGTGCKDPELRELNCLETFCPWGPNLWGPFVHRDRICCGPFVQEHKFYRDCLSRGTGSGVPEVGYR